MAASQLPYSPPKEKPFLDQLKIVPCTSAEVICADDTQEQLVQAATIRMRSHGPNKWECNPRKLKYSKAVSDKESQLKRPHFPYVH